MVLIAVGVAGHGVSLTSFLLTYRDKADASEISHMRGSITFTLPIAGIGAFVLPLVKHWNLLFGIPAIITAIATISFLTGLCCFRYDFPPPDLYQLVYFRELFNLQFTPVWLTFITYGIVSSLGRTYFVGQAKHLDCYLGKWEVPTQVLLLAQIWLAKLLSFVISTLLQTRAKVFMAKLFGVLCCITAAIMERKRLAIVRNHDLLDKPDQDIPMSVHWLLFQFILLGCMESLLVTNVIDNICKYPKYGNFRFAACLQNFTHAATGLGYMCSVLLVFVVGKISEKGGDKPSWFQSTLNRSHLDHYYWVLAVLSGTSLVIFFIWSVYQSCFRPEALWDRKSEAFEWD